MPNIKPISDLRNYTDILKQVDVSKRVYLTRNGHGEYELISKLKKSEERANLEGWIPSEDVEKELEVFE